MAAVDAPSHAALRDRRILLCVCGGIAAYKAVELVRRLRDAGAEVQVAMTDNALRFVGAPSFQAVSGRTVRTSLWDEAAEAAMGHIELARWAELVLVAPATANTLARLAHGLADDLVSTLCLATTAPIVLAPAMNHRMWGHAATQANVATLRARGVTVLEPGTGPLGSPGEFGIGRLPEPPELLAAVESALQVGGELDGAHVLVTAGGTREPIDAVRFVGNRSSGRMGFALAEEAQRRGATVTVIAANVSVPRAPGIEYVDVGTAAELADACAARFDGCDVLLMAAAVADYRPAEARDGKIKKDQTGGELNLSLVRTTDVLTSLAQRRRAGQLIVGFAAEHGDGALAYGRDKLARKNLDAIVVNDIGGAGVGFESTDNEVWIVMADEERHVPKASKGRIAAAILDAVLSRRSSHDIKVRR